MCRTHCDSFGILSFTSKPGHSFITSVAHSISSMFTQPNEHIYHQPNNPSAPSIQPIPAPCTACACSNCKPRATRKTSYTHSPQQTSSNRTPGTNARNNSADNMYMLLLCLRQGTEHIQNPSFKVPHHLPRRRFYELYKLLRCLRTL